MAKQINEVKILYLASTMQFSTRWRMLTTGGYGDWSWSNKKTNSSKKQLDVKSLLAQICVVIAELNYFRIWNIWLSWLLIYGQSFNKFLKLPKLPKPMTNQKPVLSLTDQSEARIPTLMDGLVTRHRPCIWPEASQVRSGAAAQSSILRFVDVSKY